LPYFSATAFAMLATLLLIGSPCRADEPTPASETADDPAMAQGVELRRLGRDAEALALFQRIDAERPSPRAVAQIGLAQQALGRWTDAEASLLDAMARTDDPWIARQHAYLERSLVAVQAHLGWLSVDSNVPGAEVWIGGHMVGRVPMSGPIRAPAGQTALEVRALGYAPLLRTVTVEAGVRATHVFTFVELPRIDLPAPAPSATHPERPASEPASRLVRRTGWGLAAGAGALALVGVAGFVTREWEARIYDDNARCGPLPGLSRQDRCGTNRDIGIAAEGAGIAAFAAGGIAAVASAALLFTEGKRDSSGSVSIGCRWAGTGVVCSGSF
jgi:hypothetical protein